MSGLVIRPARPDDIAALQALAREVIEVRYTPFLGEEMVAGYINSGAADAEIAKHQAHLSVAELDGALLGLVVCFEDLVHLLMTRLDQQRGGVGTALLRWSEQQIAARGYHCGRLETFTDNAQARRFYRKNGWFEVGFGAVEGAGVPLVFLEKTL